MAFPSLRKKKVGLTDEDPIRPDQKLCGRCGNLVSQELQRCPFCRHAPWTWHPNSRLLIITLLICLFLFVLLPIVNNRDKPYRVPVSETEDTTP